MKSKYRNIKTSRIINGEQVTFDSKKEAKRYDYLYSLLFNGSISGLTLQPKFKLLDTLKVEGHDTMRVKHYIADFKYIKDGNVVVEDVKGMKTPMYNMKKHMFLSMYGKEITFLEV